MHKALLNLTKQTANPYRGHEIETALLIHFLNVKDTYICLRH